MPLRGGVHPIIYDMACNEAWVSVGRDHDTPAFAVASIRHWWRKMGRRAHPKATRLYITADAGGSNGYGSRGWKHELQRFADRTGLTIEVSHFPPGTSKWNKIEHRLFCHITANWRGTPLATWETIVDRIGNTRAAAGLRVRAALDTREYPTGVTVTKSQMDGVALEPDDFHGEWNYTLAPRRSWQTNIDHCPCAAIDQHATRRLRQWLCRTQAQSAVRKSVRFPDERLVGRLPTGSRIFDRARRAFRGRRHGLVREPNAGKAARRVR